MISFTDSQIDTVITAAGAIALEQRTIFLERLGAMLAMRRHFTDDDVTDVVWLALTGLAHEAA